MKVLHVAALTGLLVIAACATGEGGAPAGPDPVREGRVIAQQQCARCHAVGAMGASPRTDAPPLREVLDTYLPDRVRMSFEEGLLIGHPDMPVFRFEPQDVDALLAYLESIN